MPSRLFDGCLPDLLQDGYILAPLSRCKTDDVTEKPRNDLHFEDKARIAASGVMACQSTNLIENMVKR